MLRLPQSSSYQLASVKIAGLYTYTELQTFDIYCPNECSRTLTLIGPNDTGKSKLIDAILWALDPNEEKKVPLNENNYATYIPQLELHFICSYDKDIDCDHPKLILKYTFTMTKDSCTAIPTFTYPSYRDEQNKNISVLQSDKKFKTIFTKLSDSICFLPQNRSNIENIPPDSSSLLYIYVTLIQIRSFILLNNALEFYTNYSCILVLPLTLKKKFQNELEKEAQSLFY